MTIGMPAPDITWIRDKVAAEDYQVSEHVMRFMTAGLLTVTDIETAIRDGDVMEIRTNPRRNGSALVHGRSGNKPLLVLCSQGDGGRLVISLAYLTTHPQWADLECARPNRGEFMANPFSQCFFCGGQVDSITIGNFDYRLEGKLYVIKGTPAGLCLQCGEKYVTADTAKKINALIESGDFSGTEEVRVRQFTS